MKDKEEAEIVNSFQELADQYEKLQNVDLSNLSKLIKDRLKELIEEAEGNSEKVRLAKMYDIDFLGLTTFLKKFFEHIKEFVKFTNEVVNMSKQNPSRNLLDVAEEVFKETRIDLKLEKFFKQFTIDYTRGTLEFGVIIDAFVVALDINDIIKNLKAEKIDSTRVAYNSKKSC